MPQYIFVSTELIQNVSCKYGFQHMCAIFIFEKTVNKFVKYFVKLK